MVDEYTSIMRNDVWDIVLRPQGKTITIFGWLYNIKHDAYGSIEKFKERFMVRGFSQREGVEYKETFSTITMYASIRVIISFTLVMRWRIYHMDVKIDFLNDIIEEEVYVEKPQGFEVHGMESHVCGLKKTFRKLKQVSILGLTETFIAWDLPRVRQILTCTSYLLGLIHLYWCCTWTNCF
jgi:hypothetical protein